MKYYSFYTILKFFAHNLITRFDITEPYGPAFFITTLERCVMSLSIVSIPICMHPRTSFGAENTNFYCFILVDFSRLIGRLKPYLVISRLKIFVD